MDFDEIEKDLDNYRKQMKTDDLLKSAHKAKEKSMQLFEDQGIASIALVFSQIFVEMIENPNKVYQKIA